MESVCCAGAHEPEDEQYPMGPQGERARRLAELRQRLAAGRAANQKAVVAERRLQARPEGAQHAGDKRRWFEERQKRHEADLQRLGLSEDQVQPSMREHKRAARDRICPQVKQGIWQRVKEGVMSHAVSC